MKARLLTLIATAALLLFGVGSTTMAQTKATHKKVRTVTGCLQQGDEANEFNLTTAGGATWEVKSDSDSLDLSAHVGHTVKITGVVSHAEMHGMKEDAKGEAKEHGVGKNSTEHGHLTATALKMVSESCNKM